MSDSVIINVRRQLHWQQRFFSDATTAMLWGFWLWLFRPIFGIFASLAGTGLGLQHSMLTALAALAPTSLETTALALLVTASLLLGWNVVAAKLRPAQPRSAQRTAHVPDYAAYFGLTSAELAECRAHQVCVVHHDEQGRIVRIEPALAPARDRDSMQRLAA